MPIPTKAGQQKAPFNISILLKVGAGLLGVLVLYIIFAEKPFSFLANDREIDQRLIVSSVVNVLCETEDGNVSGGSGTIINSDGTVITNSHIIPQDEEYILTSEQGCLIILPNQQTGQPEEMYWADPIVIPGLSDDYDLAYLEIYDVFIDEYGDSYGEYPRRFPSLFAEEHKYEEVCIFSGILNLGDPVRIFGYPQTSGGFYLTITDGVISSLPGDGLILTSAKVDEGNSGGLAVDTRGCVVGIPSAITEGRYQNLGVIISIDLILDFSQQYQQL